MRRGIYNEVYNQGSKSILDLFINRLDPDMSRREIVELRESCLKVLASLEEQCCNEAENEI